MSRTDRSTPRPSFELLLLSLRVRSAESPRGGTRPFRFSMYSIGFLPRSTSPRQRFVDFPRDQPETLFIRGRTCSRGKRLFILAFERVMSSMLECLDVKEKERKIVRSCFGTEMDILKFNNLSFKNVITIVKCNVKWLRLCELYITINYYIIRVILNKVIT